MTTPPCVDLVELCAGTASVSLWALARVPPLVGYMGSKRRDAARLCTILGARDPRSVTIVDAGPWGDVWQTLSTSDGRRGTVDVLTDWHARGTLPEVWPTLLSPPSLDAATRTAQYLCLQARSATNIPVWWSETSLRWESPSGTRTETAHQRGGAAAENRTQGSRLDGGLCPTVESRGIVRIATIAERIAALDAIDWQRVRVVHGSAVYVEPVPGSTVYIDPPYLGAPRYAAMLSRDSVIDIATQHARVARCVVVSEASPLPIPGWRAMPLRQWGCKSEWITCWGDVGQAPEQLALEACA